MCVFIFLANFLGQLKTGLSGEGRPGGDMLSGDTSWDGGELELPELCTGRSVCRGGGTIGPRPPIPLRAPKRPGSWPWIPPLPFPPLDPP